MMTNAGVLALALAIVPVACGGADPGASGSGIRGTAHIGPQCPVVQAGSPCPDAPFDGEIQVSTTEGEEVATTSTDVDGSFEVALDPGTYVVGIVTPNPGGPPFAEPVTVEVEPGAFTDIDVAIDSGIR